MECFWAILLVLASITSLAFTLIKHSKQQNPPPGPKPWPIIGNLNLIGSIPHQSLHLLSKKYGEIMLLKFGQFPVVVASTPEMAKQFLKTHDTVFSSRPVLSAGKYTSYNYLDMTWAPYGPYFLQARKIYFTEMFNPKKLKSELFERIRAEEMRDFISRLHSQSGKPVLFRDHVFRYALSTINRMVLGGKYFSESEEDKSNVRLEEFQAMLDEWFFLNGVFNFGDWIPWLNFLDLHGYVKRMKLLHKKFDELLETVISDHLNWRAAENGANESKDFVDKMLSIAEDSNLQVKLTRDCVKALTQNLIVGGADTIPTTVEWIIHELMRHPYVYQKAKDELDKVIGKGRWVEVNDFSQLPYIEAIIMETMRLHPIATFLNPHYSMEDCCVAGYNIPKGTTVLVNTWSIGRDPNTWNMSEMFFPERFVGKEIDLMGNSFVLLPFSSGRRTCPGYRLAWDSLRTILANILHGFNLKLEDGMKPEDISIEEKYRLSTHPKHALAIILEPALPAYLY